MTMRTSTTASATTTPQKDEKITELDTTVISTSRPDLVSPMSAATGPPMSPASIGNPDEYAQIPPVSTLDAIMMTPSDLESEQQLSPADVEMVREFEAKWKVFLSQHPSLMPIGRKRKSMVDLLQTMKQEFKNKQAVEAEMKKQLTFFERARQEMESGYEVQMKEATELQTEIHEYLHRHLDYVAVSEHAMRQTIPWKNFGDSLEKASRELVPDYHRLYEHDKSMKPSARAMALVDPDGAEQDTILRAYRLDHALLTTQVQMLEKEVDRMEKTTESLEPVGKFLTENNIWGLLTRQQQKQASSVNMMATVHSPPQSPAESSVRPQESPAPPMPRTNDA